MKWPRRGARLVLAAASVICMQGQTGWYNAGWRYRKTITISKTRVLAAAPLYVDLTSDADVQANAQLNTCQDVLFTAADGTTKLSHRWDKPC